MAATPSEFVVRVPNLPMGKIVDENGMPTDDELTFRQSLITLLQSLFGNEGLVMPTQSAANAQIIIDAVDPQAPNPATAYTCQFGTMLYVPNASDHTMDFILVAVDDGTGAPVFKQFTLAAYP